MVLNFTSLILNELYLTIWSTLVTTCLTYFCDHMLDLLWALLLHIPGLHFSCLPCWRPEFGLLASVAHRPLLFHLSPKNSAFVDYFTKMGKIFKPELKFINNSDRVLQQTCNNEIFLVFSCLKNLHYIQPHVA